jgi:hypothetical protein
MNDVKIYKEGNIWVVSYVENDEVYYSEPFISEEDAITFSLNLKHI